MHPDTFVKLICAVAVENGYTYRRNRYDQVIFEPYRPRGGVSIYDDAWISRSQALMEYIRKFGYIGSPWLDNASVVMLPDSRVAVAQTMKG